MENKVLDKGFVYLVDHMGNDAAVVQAARVCYRSSGLEDPERDKKLVMYLWKHKHGTPFEHAVLKFHVKCPIFVARQWFRHRMSSYNEVSGRYAEIKDEFYIPDEWRAQDTKNKQGSIEAKLDHAHMKARLENDCKWAMKAYNWYLEKGASKEMARMVVPVNVYTEFYWTVNARALMHFFELRCEEHAQWEIRQYANSMYDIFAEHMPWSAAAFSDGLDPQKYKAVFYKDNGEHV